MKDKLIHRDEVGLSNRKANEYNIRKYIQNYFKDMEEIIWLLDALPAKQVEKLLADGSAANATMKLCEKILRTMDLPMVQATYLGTGIRSVKSYDLGEDNLHLTARDPDKEIALQPIGLSIQCDLTEDESRMIERTLNHVRVIRDSLIPTRVKVSPRKFYEEIYPQINDNAEKKGVKCNLEWDICEMPKSIDLLLKAVVNQENRRKTEAMMIREHPPTDF